MVGLNQDRDDVLSMIQRLGMLEITDLTCEPGELPDGLGSPDPARMRRWRATGSIWSVWRKPSGSLEGTTNPKHRCWTFRPPQRWTIWNRPRGATGSRSWPRANDILSLKRQIADIRANMLRIENRMRQIEPWRPLLIPR